MRDVMLILHFIGLAMGLGTGFAHAFLGAASAKLDKEEATRLRIYSLAISAMGNIGIVLLIVSGFYMITPYWKILSSSPLLITKLALVLLLTVIIVIINVLGAQVKKGMNIERNFGIMKNLGKVTLITALAIVVVAVKFFH